MHTFRAAAVLVVVGVVGTAAPAEAQRFPFERSLDASGITILDVSTVRGKISVTVGEGSRVVVSGDATVRIGWDVPANAVALAQRVAEHPPVEKDGGTIRVRPPADPAERRAVTISYEVRVPPNAQVLAVSASGATSVSGILAPVVVRTQTGAIELSRLGGSAEVTSGSGSVTADGIGGLLTVVTTSSAITARELHAGLNVRTTSGAVDASLAGRGDVDVRTSSSSIILRGVIGGLTASTGSGRVRIGGVPAAPWQVSTGSGNLDVTFPADAGLALEAASGSGSVKTGNGLVGAISKRRITGTIGSGGPPVQLTSRSGSIRISVGPDR